MLFVIGLLTALACFLLLTLSVAKKPENRKFFYLFLLVDIWLSSVFIYLIYEALLN